MGTVVDYEYENEFNPRSNFGLQSKKLIDDYDYEYGYDDYYNYDDSVQRTDSDGQSKRVSLNGFLNHVWLSGKISPPTLFQETKFQLPSASSSYPTWKKISVTPWKKTGRVFT